MKSHGVEYIEARWKGKWGRSCVESDVMVKLMSS